jgi:hypothetical protein
MNIRILRIKNRITGLYAKKGEDALAGWSKRGKVWTQLNHVHAHIQGAKVNRFEEYLDSDVVELVNGEDVVIEAVSDYIAKHIDLIVSHFQFRVKDYSVKHYMSQSYIQELQRKLNKAIEIQNSKERVK